VKKLFFAGLCLFVLTGCSSTASVVSNNTNARTVSLNASEADLGDPSKWFADDAQESIVELNLPDEIGKRILGQVITGYKNQTGDLKQAESTESPDIIFDIKEITVKR